jgi:amino-acid N-acetyltransferase
MNDSFVEWFRHSSPYIHAHRDKTFVLSISGEIIQDSNFTHIIHDIALLNGLGIKLVLVLGAKPQIQHCLEQANIETKNAGHLRISTAQSIPCITSTIGKIRMEIEAQLTFSLQNTPMAGAEINVVSGNFIIAKPIGVINGIDYQQTGEVRKINTCAIQQNLTNGTIVMLTAVGYSPTGEIFNLGSEQVAKSTAIALGADKLIFLSDGKQPDDNEREISPSTAIELAKQHTSQHCYGLLAGAEACQQGVKRTHLIDGNINGALIKELLTRDGSGTLITEELFEKIRVATIDDVSGIISLIEPLEKKGVLIRRSREKLEMEIGYFCVIERDQTIIGCAALYPDRKEQMAEVACLAIHQDYAKAGRGELLLSHLVNLACRQQLNRLFVLTTQSAHWFVEKGFTESTIEELPIKRVSLYNFHRNSKVLIKLLEKGPI